MQLFFITTALVAVAPLVAAHGKLAVATGDAGGNTTALGIQGGIVPGTGSTGQTETDTTVFQQIDAQSDGLGRTEGQGKNTLDSMDDVMSQSGSTLPQVSSGGNGSISATYHIVTTDGAGPVRAIVDPTGTGAFSQGTEAEIATQVPGRGGNIAPGPLSNNFNKRWISRILGKRALNVNTDHQLSVNIPAGTSCTGTVGGQSNVCLLKVANSNPAGPFGGVLAFQMAGDAGASSSGSSTTAGTSSAAE